MSDDYKLEIALNDEGPLIALSTWEELDNWIESEKTAWSWLNPHGNGTNVANIGNSVQSHLDNIYSTSKNHQINNQPLQSISGQISSVFNGSRGPLLPSNSAVGQAILDVRTVAGDDGAAAAYAFATGATTLGSLNNRRQLLGVLASTFPAFEPIALLSDRLSKERVNTKVSARAFINELKSNDDLRDARWRDLMKLVTKIGRRALRRRQKVWNGIQENLATQQLEAIGNIRAVQKAFEESMQLQAPVKYWQDKAIKHGVAERKAITRLCLFFPIASILLGLSFWLAGAFVLKQPTGSQGVHPALYVVVSGGLAILSTFGLWIGRILTKLYLSEHHLRNDASERAVMTTTYLALTRENAASETDRQIILTALFRNSPDGIVKDDGPSDINIATLLSKLGVR